MVNLWTGNIETNGEYVNLSQVSEITFEQDKTYTIQVQDAAYIREGETGKGFYIFDCKPFTFTYTGSGLYINANKTVVNIAG